MSELPVNFLAEMDKLAAEIAAAACNTCNPGDTIVPLADKIDAFKALMPYYAHNKKLKGKNDPEDSDLPNFDKFASNIHATETDDGADESGVRSSRWNGN